ncbi:phytoene desaturase family protein [Myceligenerans indicum]|uniref:NAD(P)/FAD-dependent oxidoreductase n=1 Tax=Myceligenerans indicum TaxID=2593663 RepID=A0ABS1LRA6_9MICO|nr:NAD(P)/FAD-dependent oxidoreductase [Myceligenerans indicum]MBL0888807.1 NAD(P)/FAD-dependent oxidoreductase [Myceligenerans indicum]
MTVLDAVVVGSGPNGLAAAVTLARAGLGVRVLEEQSSAGGGARTLTGSELVTATPVPDRSGRFLPPLGADAGTGADLRFDVCSAVHPMAWASPFFRAFGLADRIELRTPEVSYAQPLDPVAGSRTARAGIAFHDLDRTVARLGADGAAWRSLIGPLADHWPAVAALAMGDKRGLATPASVRSAPVPGADPDRGGRRLGDDPVIFCRRDALGLGTEGLALLRAALGFGPGLVEQGTGLWNRRFAADVAPALLTGVAAHVMTPLPSLAGAGTALLLGALAHGPHGWALPVGGSGAIVEALVADLVAHGGEVETSRPVRTRADLPPARAYLFDTAPGVVGQVFGDHVPRSSGTAMRRYRFGGGAAKVDLVLRGPVPWAVDDVGRAGTVHLGGTREQMAEAEATVAAGRPAVHPVCLLSDPSVTDPGRQVDGLRPLWAYAHVPAGSQRDVTEDVVGQIERFAPGFRDLVVAARCVPAAQLSAHNANYVGGDIGAGAATMPRMLAAPGPTGTRWDPYRTGVDGVYLCSAVTPPGPGVHGMSGWHAARRVLVREFEIRHPPALSPRD